LLSTAAGRTSRVIADYRHCCHRHHSEQDRVSDGLAAPDPCHCCRTALGGGAAGAASVALTPFVGVPVGIFVGIYVFAKVVRLISGKK
jgi:hypothetical protein